MRLHMYLIIKIKKLHQTIQNMIPNNPFLILKYQDHTPTAKFTIIFKRNLYNNVNHSDLEESAYKIDADLNHPIQIPRHIQNAPSLKFKLYLGIIFYIDEYFIQFFH